MDPLSHALVGSVSASLHCKRKEWLRAAVLCGVVSGMAPDLDVLIRDAANPMLGLGYHRHFTHALIFAPFGAFITAAFAWLILRRKISFWVLYGFSVAGMGMHGVLDAMTNYGTHLFWPFTNRRESWSIISIIDPIFTLTLLTLVLLTVFKKSRRFVIAAACFAAFYWGIGFYQNRQATDAMRQLAASRGHVVEHHEIKPSFGNLLVWRTQYLHKKKIYIDAFHVSPWRGRVLYEGGSLALFTPPNKISDVQKRDLEFFTFFSDGWLAYAPLKKDLIGDVRFSILPNQLDPIWGIRLVPESPESHVLFENTRIRREGDWAELWQMIKGEKVIVGSKE